jgi:hypothetical protein
MDVLLAEAVASIRPIAAVSLAIFLCIAGAWNMLFSVWAVTRPEGRPGR